MQVLVRGPLRAEIWDGRAPVRPNDALAFRIACEGFARVAVLAWVDAKAPAVRMYEGACPQPAAVLPFSLVVDSAPGDESVAVVLSTRRLDDRALQAAALERRKGKDVWSEALRFSKAGAP